MKLQFVAKSNNGCDYHRLVLPMEYIHKEQSDDFHMFLQTKKDERFPELGDTDIIFFNRLLETPASELSEIRKKTGCKIVVDLDDYWELFLGHAYYDYWQRGELYKKIPDNVRIADLVLCTNEQLRKEILPLNRNVVIVPNAIPFDKDQFVPGITTLSDKTRFIYVGGSSHLQDIELLRGKFKRINSDPSIKDNAEFILAGYNPNRESGDVWHKMRSVFGDTGSSKILPGLHFDKYMSLYNEGDVALVPLVDNRFNRSKSVLKVLEASVKNLPCIVSSVWPYLELKDYPGILWVETPSDWLKHIKFCIKNPNWVKEQGVALNEAIRQNYSLDVWNTTRYQLFDHLINQPHANKTI